MILPVLTALIVILGALAAGVEMAGAALRDGRAHFRQAIVGAGAERGLAESMQGVWVGAGTVLPLGGRMVLPPIADRPGVVIVRDVRRLSAELWLIHSRAEVTTIGGGAVLAAEERGLVVRLVQDPTDSTFQVIPIPRPWNRRGT